MRFIYVFRFADGGGGTCISVDRIWDCLRYFRDRLPSAEVVAVWENGIPSYQLPLSPEEAEAIQTPTIEKEPAHGRYCNQRATG